MHRAPTRYGPALLTHLDQATGRAIRHYERDRADELAHADIKKLDNIPDGGGHKALGRSAGRKNPANDGYSHLHTDEKKEITTAFRTRAQAFLTSCGITVKQVLTDNSSCYKSHTWRNTLAAARITRKRTRPYRPQTSKAAHLKCTTRRSATSPVQPGKIREAIPGPDGIP